MLLTIIEIAVFMAAAAIIGVALGWVLRGSLGREQGEISDLRSQVRQLKKASRETSGTAKNENTAAQTATTSQAAPKTAAPASEKAKPESRPAAKAEPASKAAPAKSSSKKPAKRKSQAEREADQAAGRAAFAEVIGRIGKSGAKDNLTKIYGIGKRYEAMLNELDVTAYSQIAELKKADRKTLAAALGVLDDRIETEDWVGSARKLIKEAG